MASERLDLFGGAEPWSPVDWTDSDDRVRGGKSQSYFSASPFEPVARFYGNLDIETLGGAGFASQRTTGDDRCYNLEDYDGIELEIEKGDSKRYTLNLKDSLLPPDPSTGREQSTVSYEYDFTIEQDTALSDCTKIRVPWSKFTATYRGREQKDAPAITTKEVRRVSIMMRSFFGTQDGPFTLSIRRISAYKDDEQGAVPQFMSSRAKLLIPVAFLGGTLCLTGLFVFLIDRLSAR